MHSENIFSWHPSATLGGDRRLPAEALLTHYYYSGSIPGIRSEKETPIGCPADRRDRVCSHERQVHRDSAGRRLRCHLRADDELASYTGKAAQTAISVTIAGSAETIDITAADGVVISGQVKDAAGKTMKSGTVALYPIDPSDPDVHPVMQMAKVDKNGTYRLCLRSSGIAQHGCRSACRY